MINAPCHQYPPRQTSYAAGAVSQSVRCVGEGQEIAEMSEAASERRSFMRACFIMPSFEETYEDEWKN